MASRRLKRKELPAPNILIAPLIDCIFILLLFFMLVNRFLAPSIDVELPRSASATITEEKAIHIAIDFELSLFVEDRKVEWEELSAVLSRLKSQDEPKIVRIKSDKTVPIEYIVRAIDAVRAAGLKSVSLEAETRQALEVENRMGGGR